MRIVVVSCWKYRDAWKPFFTLLDKFWQNHPDVTLLSDCPPYLASVGPFDSVAQFDYYPELSSYGPRIARFAQVFNDEPIVLLQEDFFLNAPVKAELVREAEELLYFYGAGTVRLYPCPGSNVECGNAHFGFVERGSPYRISLQASIWQPSSE